MFNPLKFLSNIVKNSNERELDKIKKTLNLVNSFESKMKELKDEEFPKKTLYFIERLKAGEKINNLLP